MSVQQPKMPVFHSRSSMGTTLPASGCCVMMTVGWAAIVSVLGSVNIKLLFKYCLYEH